MSNNLWIYGCRGRMGEVLARCTQANPDWNWCGGTTSAGDCDTQGKPSALKDAAVDAIIDFSSPAGNAALHKTLQKNELRDKRVLIATTGLDDKLLVAWHELTAALELRVLLAPNTSIGIALLVEAALAIVRTCGAEFDIELNEAHHRDKQDAPSGTALYIAQRLCQQDSRYFVNTQRQGLRRAHEIGINAVRGGKIYGEHHVAFLGDDEEITITHRALSRTLFAKGALHLATWLDSRSSGFYTLEDVKY